MEQQAIQITSALLGSLVGIILALTGAGGAIIAVPLLIFGLHLAVAEAAPIALLAVSLSAAIGAMLALKLGKVRYRAAGLIAVSGVLTAPIGIWAAHKLPNAPLTLLFAIVLAYVAVHMLRQSKAAAAKAEELRPAAVPCQLDTVIGRLIWTEPCARALAISGAVAGSLSGLLGVGGGFVVVPALRKATNLQMQSILATSLAVIALISATGVASAVLIGGMDWSIGLPFSAGAIAGMVAGGMFARRFAGPKLQQSFAVLALCVAMGMVVKVLLAADIV
ncbi:MAG: sulfite exporter TauE/SafE family protein [Pseudomonadota bacterium]